MARFLTYDLAVQFYRMIVRISMPQHLANQCLRAAASIALNLQEGAGRYTLAERKRFYRVAFGSYRESKAILDLVNPKLPQESQQLISHLGACLYKLVTQQKSK